MKTPKSYTEIAFVLDRSGSMEVCADSAIAGFNHFLADQQQTPGLARLTLVLFDDQYLVPVQSVPVQEVTPMNARTFEPRGSTALLDAIGQTIDQLGQRLAGLSAADRPSQVIVAILTDGEENSSRIFSWAQIAEKIRHQSEVYNWTFLFLGANQDAIATAAKMHIAAANAATYTADSAGAHASHSAFSRKVRALRSIDLPGSSAREREDSLAPLGSILQEEDQKSRSQQAKPSTPSRSKKPGKPSQEK